MNAVAIQYCSLTDLQAAIWYLGQEGILLKSCGHFLAVDPYLSDYVDRNCSQAIPWKRAYAPPIAPEALDFLDVVLCTHVHADHADPDTLPVIARANPNTKFIVPAPELDTIASYGIDREQLIPACADKPITVGCFTVTPIPSAHEVLHRDEHGNYRELGYIIDSPAGRFFHAGDMCMYDGLTERLTDIDVAFLPINGRDYFRNQLDIIGNFDCIEAVTLAKIIGAGLLIPLHHDLYAVNGLHPSVFVNTVHELDQFRRFHIFAPGERYIFQKD